MKKHTLKKIKVQDLNRQEKRTNKLKEKFGDYSTSIYFEEKNEETLNKLSANHPKTKSENKKEKYCILINELIKRLYIETHFMKKLKENKTAQETYQSYTLISNYLYLGKQKKYIKSKLDKKKFTPPNPYKEWNEQCILEMSLIDNIINKLIELK